MKRICYIALAAILISLLSLVNNHNQVIAAPQADEALWTRWSHEHYALADDNDVIWIGTGAGIIRWNKADETYQRFGAPDGIPHRHVYAVAVDSSGNRWFGGDAGVSKLDASETWTHYNAGNSALADREVHDIAVTDSGTVYLGHGIPNGKVTRIVGAQWTSYDSRQAAVEGNSAEILQASNQTNLWTTRLNEIWVDYNVWNGSEWQLNKPDSVPDTPLTIMGANDGKIWALTKYYGGVYVWDGIEWNLDGVGSSFGGGTTALTVLDDNSAWIGLHNRDHFETPYGQFQPSLVHIDGTTTVTAQNGIISSLYTPFSTLLETPAGLWGTGPQWLLTPEKLITFDDGYMHEHPKHIVKDTNDRLLVTSFNVYPYSIGSLQQIEDNQTVNLNDDAWQPLTLTISPDEVNTMAAAANGDVWISHNYYSRLSSTTLMRLHNGDVSTFSLPVERPSRSKAVDIAIQDEWVWLAVAEHSFEAIYTGAELENNSTHVVGLNPLDTAQSITYAAPTDGSNGQVAVAATGDVWFGDSSGLYRRGESDWIKLSDQAVAEIVAASDGSVIAAVKDTRKLLYVSPQGVLSSPTISAFTSANRSLITTLPANQIWKTTPSGDTWFLDKPNAVSILTDSGITDVMLPQSPIEITRSDIASWVVDTVGQPWFVADGAVWRFSSQPTFALLDTPIMLEAGEGAQRPAEIVRFGGFDEPLALSVMGAVPGITVTVSAETTLDTSSTITITTSPSITTGLYAIGLTATGTTVERSATVTVRVVDTVYRSYLPVVARP